MLSIYWHRSLCIHSVLSKCVYLFFLSWRLAKNQRVIWMRTPHCVLFKWSIVLTKVNYACYITWSVWNAIRWVVEICCVDPSKHWNHSLLSAFCGIVFVLCSVSAKFSINLRTNSGIFKQISSGGKQSFPSNWDRFIVNQGN